MSTNFSIDPTHWRLT